MFFIFFQICKLVENMRIGIPEKCQRENISQDIDKDALALNLKPAIRILIA